MVGDRASTAGARGEDGGGGGGCRQGAASRQGVHRRRVAAEAWRAAGRPHDRSTRARAAAPRAVAQSTPSAAVEGRLGSAKPAALPASGGRRGGGGGRWRLLVRAATRLRERAAGRADAMAPTGRDGAPPPLPSALPDTRAPDARVGRPATGASRPPKRSSAAAPTPPRPAGCPTNGSGARGGSGPPRGRRAVRAALRRQVAARPARRACVWGGCARSQRPGEGGGCAALTPAAATGNRGVRSAAAVWD